MLTTHGVGKKKLKNNEVGAYTQVDPSSWIHYKQSVKIKELNIFLTTFVPVDSVTDFTGDANF